MKKIFIFIILLILTLIFSAILFFKKTRLPSHSNTILLATTTSTVGSGLLQKLLPPFEKKYGMKVTVIAKGTGASLKLAREGKADVVLVHARVAEDKFISEGFGINRKDVMYNDFVLIGPSNDPAGVVKTETIDKAFSNIFNSKSVFISRGDNSGTHMRERSLWVQIGLYPEKQAWYIRANTGMLKTLEKASRDGAYVLTDRSTYLYNKDKLSLIILFEGDSRLFNPYGIIAVNPTMVPGVNFKGAMRFIDYITSKET